MLDCAPCVPGGTARDAAAQTWSPCVADARAGLLQQPGRHTGCAAQRPCLAAGGCTGCPAGATPLAGATSQQLPTDEEALYLLRLNRRPLPLLAVGAIPLPGGTSQQLLTEEEAALVQRFDPSAELDTIGFFVAKFVKQPKSSEA